MSRAEHEALVEEAGICAWDIAASLPPETEMEDKYCAIARAILTLIARTLETVTEEMVAAYTGESAHFETHWRSILAASPLSPGRQDAEKKDNADDA